jgi:hypothetical protein
MAQPLPGAYCNSEEVKQTMRTRTVKLFWMQRRSVTAAKVGHLDTLPATQFYMKTILLKTILLFTCAITLFATTGCFFPGGRGGGRGWHDRGEVIVAPSAVAQQQVPEVIVAPPIVEVRAPEVVVR